MGIYCAELPSWSGRVPSAAEVEREIRMRGYRTDPAAYAREALGVVWWEKQVEAAEALLKHKRVFVKASHSVGKSFLAGGLVNWFFDCFYPGICVTTAPNAAQVRDILWKEVRVQRPVGSRRALQPKAPRMETTPDHFAVGLTAKDGSGFQGRHEEHVLIVFDECVGVAAPFWDAAEGMMTGDDCYFLAICNPTDTGSRAYLECQNRSKWHVIEISALEHPNIAAELAGEPVPFPKAVRLGWVEGKLREWCTPLPATSPPSPPPALPPNIPLRGGEGGFMTAECGLLDGSFRAGDFEFPVVSGRWWRPGALFESRVLGRWPSQGADSVWSEAMWRGALVERRLDPAERLAIGCDVARFGDDFTSMVVALGGCVLHHETHNGWDTKRTAARLKELAAEFTVVGWRGTETSERRGTSPHPTRVEVHVDDDGVGGGVMDQADGYCFLAVSAAERALEPGGYPNRRSEMWFTTAALALEGRLDLSRLSAESLELIRRQVMAPTWKLDSQGRRVVEAKAETKRRIGRSPDDADALNLAFAPISRVEQDDAFYAEYWASFDREDAELGRWR